MNIKIVGQINNRETLTHHNSVFLGMIDVLTDTSSGWKMELLFQTTSQRFVDLLLKH